MALTAEEQRALLFNLSLGKRHAAAKNRAYTLRGSASAKDGLTERMSAITRSDDYGSRKVRYDSKNDGFQVAGDAINGHPVEDEPGTAAGVPRNRG